MKNFLGTILGPRLREARKAKALTSTVCAKAVGVSQPAWNMWEMGVRLPKIELLSEICVLLEVTPNHLLGFDTPSLRASASPRETNINGSFNIVGDGNNLNVKVPPPSSSSSSTAKKKGKKK